MSNQIRNKLISLIEEEVETLWLDEKKTINEYPEYYLSVKVAEGIKTYFSSYSFTMEDRAIDLVSDLNAALRKDELDEINIEKQDERFRLKNGAVDLILKKKNKLRHLVEFKRASKLSSLMEDALRLAWFCCNAPLGHRAETNYLVVITHKSDVSLIKMIEKIENNLSEDIELPNVNVQSYSLNFPDDYFSTRRSVKRKNTKIVVVGRLIEFKYKEQ